jgi:hypothetical protein
LGTTELHQWRLEDAAYVDGLVTDDDGHGHDNDCHGHGHGHDDDDNDCHGHGDDGDIIGDSYGGYVVMML